MMEVVRDLHAVPAFGGGLLMSGAQSSRARYAEFTRACSVTLSGNIDVPSWEGRSMCWTVSERTLRWWTGIDLGKP